MTKFEKNNIELIHEISSVSDRYKVDSTAKIGLTEQKFWMIISKDCLRLSDNIYQDLIEFAEAKIWGALFNRYELLY